MENPLYFESYTSSELNLILRDLGESETLNVKELLTLKSSAKLQGDISTNKLSIEPGAVFSGSCSMGGVLKNMIKDDMINTKTENSSKLQEQSA